jgi:hypothetical protein
MQLADLQRQLAASLTGPSAPSASPAGLSTAAIDRVRQALVAKRCRALCQLLPRTARALGDARAACLRRHCARYLPSAMAYHIDDAWELAAQLTATAPPWRRERESSAQIRSAAHDDLAILRLQYKRRRHGALRIQERRGPLLTWLSTPRRTLLLRLPGRHGKVWRWPR